MTGFPDKEIMAELTAKMLLEVEAVRFMTDKPFIYTSGWASPVYTDCRRLISFPRVRNTLIDFGAATIMRDAGFEQFDSVAGGETSPLFRSHGSFRFAARAEGAASDGTLILFGGGGLWRATDNQPGQLA